MRRNFIYLRITKQVSITETNQTMKKISSCIIVEFFVLMESYFHSELLLLFIFSSKTLHFCFLMLIWKKNKRKTARRKRRERESRFDLMMMIVEWEPQDCLNFWRGISIWFWILEYSCSHFGRLCWNLV